MSEYENVHAFNDRRGLAVGVGDEVAYAIRQGNTAELKVGVVEDIWRYSWQTGPDRFGTRHLRHSWIIQVKAQGGSKPSRLEHPERIVKVRSAKEIELAEREAELRAMPARAVFGSEGSVPTDKVDLTKGHVNLITFGEAAYDA